MKALLFIPFILSLILVGGVAAQQTADPAIGKRLYRSYCYLCHGKEGNSKGPLAEKLGLKPANLTSDKYQKKNIDEMTALIGGYGRTKGDMMPAWRNAIAESNIRHIAAYLAIIKSKSLRFLGDARRGRTLFRNTCVSCHGPKGRGNGILAIIIGIKMVDFTNPESIERYSDKALISLITKGKRKFMPGWEGSLNETEIIDVAAYVRGLSK